MTRYTKSYGATAYLTFNDKQIALTASDLSNPEFEYHADSFYTAVSLGSLDDAISTIGRKAADIVGSGDDEVGKKIRAQIASVQNVPGLGDAMKVILENDLVLTDFVIKTRAKVYEFGLGLRLTENNILLGPVTLDGISILVKVKGTD